MNNKQLHFQGKFLTLYTYDQTMLDGSVENFEVCLMRSIVKFYVFPDPEHILLVHEYRYETANMRLRVGGAFMEDGETPEEAVIRECQEELGVKPAKLQLYATDYQGYGEDRIPEIYHFICSDLTSSKLPGDPGEKIEPMIVSIEEYEQKILHGDAPCSDTDSIFLRILHDVRLKHLEIGK